MAALRNYAHLLLNLLGLLGCLILIGMIDSRHPTRFDFTPEKRHTLSEHSHAVLDQVDTEVEVIAFTRREDPRNRLYEDLMGQVTHSNPNLRFRIVDVNRNPSLARKYQANSYGTLIVRSGGREKRLAHLREETLMAAILQVTREETKTIYFLTGHGERDIRSLDRRRGYSTVSAILEEEFYDVRTLSLLSGAKVPKDAAAVVVAAPRKNLLSSELLELARYFTRGGALMALVDPGTAPSWIAFVEQYGIRLPDQVVADGDLRLASSEALSARISNIDENSLITARLAANPVFSLFRPVEVAHVGAFNRNGDYRELLHTSMRSWAIPAPGGQIPAEVEFSEGRDQYGSFSLGVTLQVPIIPVDPVHESDGRRFQEQGGFSRLVVLGDSDFGSNFFIDLLGNRDLFVNAVNWLAAEESLIGIRPFRKQIGKEQFFVSERQRYNAFWLSVVIQPGLFLAAGIFMCAWRNFR